MIVKCKDTMTLDQFVDYVINRHCEVGIQKGNNNPRLVTKNKGLKCHIVSSNNVEITHLSKESINRVETWRWKYGRMVCIDVA